MENYKMFRCAMFFLWSMFIAFFILLCLTSCKYEKITNKDGEFVKFTILPSQEELNTLMDTDTLKWPKE